MFGLRRSAAGEPEGNGRNGLDPEVRSSSESDRVRSLQSPRGRRTVRARGRLAGKEVVMTALVRAASQGAALRMYGDWLVSRRRRRGPALRRTMLRTRDVLTLPVR